VFAVAICVLVGPPLLFSQPWEAWIYRALVLLVIACPCALVISTPVSIVSGLTAMARRGVLIKGGVFLEEVGRLRALAVDKTGTITEGKPKIQKVLPWGKFQEEHVISAAASIDVHSEHPLAKAVIAFAHERGIAFRTSGKYQSLSGRGAEAEMDGVKHIVGNHRFAHELGLCSPALEAQLQSLEDEALSVVVVARLSAEKEVLGIIGIGDSVRAEAKQAIQALHAAGIQKVVMLSGDNQKTVNSISKTVGIDEAFGDLLPDAKIDHVRRLLKEYGHVGMIGDGVNDAPAMAVSSIGIAMGAAGTDTAIETADIALMQDNLSRVAQAVTLGRKTLGIIRANIAFSLLVKAVFLVLAFAGVTSLWLAILADTGATLLVIANALRLLGKIE
jgi:Zn2+/Cd2+-exporting ATPase